MLRLFIHLNNFSLITLTKQTTMITYTLSWPAENDEFINLDDARDVAFEVSRETGALIEIYQNFGASSIVVEVVNA